MVQLGPQHLGDVRQDFGVLWLVVQCHLHGTAHNAPSSSKLKKGRLRRPSTNLDGLRTRENRQRLSADTVVEIRSCIAALGALGQPDRLRPIDASPLPTA